jgi:hypothetical protein
MARVHETDYTRKHPHETKTNSGVDAEIISNARNNQMPCAVAFEIALKLNVPVKEVGISMDFLNVRLTKCQLGLFGHESGKKIASPSASVDPALEEAIRARLTEGRLSCEKAWEIASRLSLGKMAVSCACEALKIKIKPCQLGAF